MLKRLLLLTLPLLAYSCVGDDVLEDYVDPQLRVTNAIDSLTIDSSHQLSVSYFDAIGREVDIAPRWESSEPEVVSVTEDGLAVALSLGEAELTARYEEPLSRSGTVSASFTVATAENPVIVVEPENEKRGGEIVTTSSYVLEGDFTIEEQDDGSLLLKIAENYRASTALPDLFLYLTNNPNSINDALVVADVEIFSGAHEYVIPATAIEDYKYLLYYCKPFRVKVGDGEIVDAP